MTDQALRRVDELLTELTEHVETARTVPMSSSIVLPRERVLDLLDELREVLPPEMNEARKLIATRDTVLHDAHTDAAAARETATAAAELMLVDASAKADELIRAAQEQAYEIVEAGKAEHAQLVSASGVHAAAAEAAAAMRADAERYHAETLAEAQRYSMDIRNQADNYAGKLTLDSEDYADRTLAELAGVLQRASATAEQGRAALAARRAPRGQGSGDPLTDQDWHDENWSDAAVSA